MLVAVTAVHSGLAHRRIDNLLKRIAMHIRRHDWFAVAVEILVVVIGLLLAFQFDRWREDRVERAEERVYIQRLVADVGKDIPEIEYAIDLQSLRLELADLLIAAIETPEVALDKPVLFIGAVNQAAFTYTPELTSHTFENLRSTGNLRLIRSESVKNALFDYYGFDASQRQYRPLQFATEARHFELVAGVLTVAQDVYLQDEWLIFSPDKMAEIETAAPPDGDVLEVAIRLGERDDAIAWLPYVRQMQAEQVMIHGMRLDRAREVLALLTAYYREIGGGS